MSTFLYGSEVEDLLDGDNTGIEFPRDILEFIDCYWYYRDVNLHWGELLVSNHIFDRNL